MKLDHKKIEKISKALGDPYRLKMIEMINKGSCSMQCSAIIEKFDLSQSTISHHMKQLADADLIITEKDGRNANYQINKDVFNAYIKFLNNFNS